MPATLWEVERLSKTACVAVRTQSLSAPRHEMEQWHWMSRAIAGEREFTVFDMVPLLPRPSWHET
jgi:hypothetical protein